MFTLLCWCCQVPSGYQVTWKPLSNTGRYVPMKMLTVVLTKTFCHDYYSMFFKAEHYGRKNRKHTGMEKRCSFKCALYLITAKGNVNRTQWIHLESSCSKRMTGTLPFWLHSFICSFLRTSELCVTMKPVIGVFFFYLPPVMKKSWPLYNLCLCCNVFIKIYYMFNFSCVHGVRLYISMFA